jgi:hypothetical protein
MGDQTGQNGRAVILPIAAETVLTIVPAAAAHLGCALSPAEATGEGRWRQRLAIDRGERPQGRRNVAWVMVERRSALWTAVRFTADEGAPPDLALRFLRTLVQQFHGQ